MCSKIVYSPLNQKRYCCVPTCVCMILDRRGIAHEDQESIGFDLGLIVPEDKANLFAKVRTGDRLASGWGTQVQEERYSLNSYFRKRSILLKESYFFADDISNVSEFIFDNLRKDNGIIVCFNNKSLYGSGDWGHVSLVQELDSGVVTLVDPEDIPNKIRTVLLDDLVRAMRLHGRQNRGGFWIISTV